MAAATGMRATLSAHINGERLKVEVSGDLWDRFRALRHARGMSEEGMIRWLTVDGQITLSERQVQLFVETLEGGLPYP